MMALLKFNTAPSTSSVKSNVADSSKGKEGKRSDSKVFVKCLKCDAEHGFFMCPKCLAISPKSKYRFIKSINACINCLQKHGNKKCDLKKTCKICSKPPNYLLYFEATDSPSVNTGS